MIHAISAFGREAVCSRMLLAGDAEFNTSPLGDSSVERRCFAQVIGAREVRRERAPSDLDDLATELDVLSSRPAPTQAQQPPSLTSGRCRIAEVCFRVILKALADGSAMQRYRRRIACRYNGKRRDFLAVQMPSDGRPTSLNCASRAALVMFHHHIVVNIAAPARHHAGSNP